MIEKKNARVSRVLVYLFLIIWAFIVLFPFYWMVLTSVKDTAAYNNEKIPEFILYLGKVIPYTAMGLLIVYCLRDVTVLHGSHGLPELIAMAAVTGSYLWKRNAILSVIIGTVLYMFLLQVVF